MSSAVDLTIVVPAYNEARRIVVSLATLSDHLQAHCQDLGTVDVLVVVARGDDRTAELARAQADAFETFDVLDAGEPAGKGRDVRLGMQAARGRYRLFMDADLATPLHHLETVAKLIRQDVDVIIGVRDLQQSHQGVRKVISNFGNYLVRRLLRLDIHDTQCGFKAFRGPVADDLFGRQTILGWGFDIEILALAAQRGYRIETIAIDDWQEVAGGTFKNVAVTGALSTFRDLLKVRRSLRKSKRN
jgi:glycosyltransferase involved in cell wall biosynthesis